jgi:hypothetical protein
MAFSNSGNLYVSNFSTITALSPNGSILGTINGVDKPKALAFDRSDNLAVANDENGLTRRYSVVVFRGQFSTLIPMERRHPEAVAFDSKGDLFVRSVGSIRGMEDSYVAVYQPGSTSIWYTIGDVRDLAERATAIAIDDSNDDVYVGGYYGIKVYRDRSLVRTIEYTGSPRAMVLGP